MTLGQLVDRSKLGDYISLAIYFQRRRTGKVHASVSSEVDAYTLSVLYLNNSIGKPSAPAALLFFYRAITIPNFAIVS